MRIRITRRKWTIIMMNSNRIIGKRSTRPMMWKRHPNRRRNCSNWNRRQMAMHWRPQQSDMATVYWRKNRSSWMRTIRHFFNHVSGSGWFWLLLTGATLVVWNSSKHFCFSLRNSSDVMINCLFSICRSSRWVCIEMGPNRYLRIFLFRSDCRKHNCHYLHCIHRD